MPSDSSDCLLTGNVHCRSVERSTVLQWTFPLTLSATECQPGCESNHAEHDPWLCCVIHCPAQACRSCWCHQTSWTHSLRLLGCRHQYQVGPTYLARLGDDLCQPQSPGRVLSLYLSMRWHCHDGCTEDWEPVVVMGCHGHGSDTRSWRVGTVAKALFTTRGVLCLQVLLPWLWLMSCLPWGDGCMW